jgi:hypothetical protein
MKQIKMLVAIMLLTVISFTSTANVDKPKQCVSFFKEPVQVTVLLWVSPNGTYLGAHCVTINYGANNTISTITIVPGVCAAGNNMYVFSLTRGSNESETTGLTETEKSLIIEKTLCAYYTDNPSSEYSTVNCP